jgi:hypothetical protein
VIFVHDCIHQLAYCAVVMGEDFDAVEVCCETVVACVESEVCHCVLLDEAMASWENFCCGFLFYKSLYCFEVGGVCVCFEVWLFFLPVGQLFCCRGFLRVRGPTERRLFCPVC